jgi:hypothetical protein
MTALTHAQRVQRAALIEQCYQRSPGRGRLAAIQEGAQRFREGTRPGTAAQKAARRARKAQEAADRALVERMVAKRLALARTFSEASIGPALREASNADLAVITAAALSGAGQPGPAERPVVEMAIDPAGLDLQDLAVAAAVGSAGNSPFWTGQTAGGAPFWRGPQGTGASKGTADADQ